MPTKQPVPKTAKKTAAKKAPKTSAKKPATTSPAKTAAKKTATTSPAKKAAKKPAAKSPAEKLAANQSAAKKNPAKKRPEVDPLRELAWDCYCAFDAEDPTPAMQIEFVEGYLSSASSRGLTVDFDAALPYCAEILELEIDDLRATWEAHGRKFAAVRGASGGAGELDALVELCQTEGRFGAAFEDHAARALAAAWPRLGPAFARRLLAGRQDLRLRNAGPFATLVGFEAATRLRSLQLDVTPDCDLAPLAALTRLTSLNLKGKRHGFGPLARLPRLTQLEIEADATGIAELADLPTLRVLSLVVAEDVSIASLLDLAHLVMLKLLAGSRSLDEVTADTIARLARKKSRWIRLAEHEGWPLQLAVPFERTPAFVEINRR
ncbi:hypothetical protein [Nannocystis bainbridge]|uniref:Leucine-rich repeat domain-containing protein n=1 Tax=Nannocystis bainbridge TaxID=2995303 RepID=A0ABT5E3I2_9BACT|nr:hypothetical protein [Nannocystis bainbridge]MDC0719960.1 hypothetical protein [Nannocystis bainbridge]